MFNLIIIGCLLGIPGSCISTGYVGVRGELKQLTPTECIRSTQAMELDFAANNPGYRVASVLCKPVEERA